MARRTGKDATSEDEAAPSQQMFAPASAPPARTEAVVPSPSTPFMVINVPSGPEANPKKAFRSALPTMPAMRLHEDLMPVHPPPMPALAPLVPPPAPARRSRVLPILGAALLLVIGLAVIGPSLGSGSGKMLVTVSGPGNRQVDALEIFVDGQRRCSTSPCRVSGLETGKHFVQVKAPGYDQSSELPVDIEGGADPSSIHIPLSRAAAASAEKGPEAAPKGEIKDEGDGAEPRGVDAENAGVAVNGPARVAMSRAGGSTPKSNSSVALAEEPADDTPGTLRINSVPLSKVLVDGRPLGNTPKIIKVAPGPHTVVLVGPTGRAVRNVTVKPGKAVAVGVRF